MAFLQSMKAKCCVYIQYLCRKTTTCNHSFYFVAPCVVKLRRLTLSEDSSSSLTVRAGRFINESDVCIFSPKLTFTAIPRSDSEKFDKYQLWSPFFKSVMDQVHENLEKFDVWRIIC